MLMKENETLAYTPLEIDIVEVQIEKGYAATTPTGNRLNDMDNDDKGW